jgi:hypothetical protein
MKKCFFFFFLGQTNKENFPTLERGHETKLMLERLLELHSLRNTQMP